MKHAQAPLFRDPIFDGAADPTIIWHRQEQSWWLLYTNRRANVPCQGFSWVHGTDIGIASSQDQGQTWTYRGILEGLEFDKGRNTFWAPEVLWHGGLYHMYVSYVPGVPVNWQATRHIIHMTSENLWHWHFESRLKLSSDRVIDACIYRMPDGLWRMWYKDEANNSHTYLAESRDLYKWQVVGPVITDCPHEGPNVFYWQGSYWMITDPWQGLGVYRSQDASKWEKQGYILNSPGERKDDKTNALHANVLVQGEQAYIFYFTHPDRVQQVSADEDHSYSSKRSSIQVAALEVQNGLLVCDRNKAFPFDLNPET